MSVGEVRLVERFPGEADYRRLRQACGLSAKSVDATKQRCAKHRFARSEQSVGMFYRI